jgi:hypothetical protein
MSVRNAVTRIPNHEHSVPFARIFWSCAGFGLAVGFLELLRLWFQILHDYGDATVGCIERLSGRALHLIGIAWDFRNLVAPQSVVLHQSSGGIGAVGGELPIPVFAAARVGLGIGVTFDRDMVW